VDFLQSRVACHDLPVRQTPYEEIIDALLRNVTWRMGVTAMETLSSNESPATCKSSARTRRRSKRSSPRFANRSGPSPDAAAGGWREFKTMLN